MDIIMTKRLTMLYYTIFNFAKWKCCNSICWDGSISNV